MCTDVGWAVFAVRYLAAVSRRGLWHTMEETCRATFPPETNTARTMDIISRDWFGQSAMAPHNGEVDAHDVQLREGARNILQPGH